MYRTINVQEFVNIYKIKIRDYHTQGEYEWPLDQLDSVVSRMQNAFVNGTYNYDGKAIKATCKQLGIRHTVKAMEEYFNRVVK